MPILKKHLKKLDNLVKSHQLIIKIATDKKILDALNELSDNPELRKKVAKNPSAYVKDKGITLPKGTKVTFWEGSYGGTIYVEIGDSASGCRITMGYDSDSGFSCDISDIA